MGLQFHTGHGHCITCFPLQLYFYLAGDNTVTLMYTNIHVLLVV